MDHRSIQSKLNSLNEKIDKDHWGAIIYCIVFRRSGGWSRRIVYMEVGDDVDIGVGGARHAEYRVGPAVKISISIFLGYAVLATKFYLERFKAEL